MLSRPGPAFLLLGETHAAAGTRDQARPKVTQAHPKVTQGLL